MSQISYVNGYRHGHRRSGTGATGPSGAVAGEREASSTCRYPIKDYPKIVELFGASALEAISELVEDTVLELGRFGSTERTPAEALEALRRNDLSEFDWAPQDEEGIRFFLSEYVSHDTCAMILGLTTEGFNEFLGACDVESPWNGFLVDMVGAARLGAVRAYRTMLGEGHAVDPGGPAVRTRKGHAA